MPKIYKISAKVETPTVGSVTKGTLSQKVDEATDMYVSVEGFNGIYQNLLKVDRLIKLPKTNSGIKTIKEYIDVVFTGDTFITGNTINEMSDYRGHHSMTTEHNTYNGTSSYASVGIPTFSVSSATRTFTGLSTGTTGVNIEDGTSFTLPFAFTGNQSTISANSVDFKFKMFKYDSSVSGFSTTPVYSSDEFSYSSHTNNYTFTSGITKTSLVVDNFDGEYLIKGFYEYDAAHPISKRLKLRHDNYNIITGTSLNIYQPNNDWYMVMLEGAQRPEFNSVGGAAGSEQIGGTLKNTVKTIEFDGQTTFSLNDSVNGDIIVAVNGIVVTKDLEYTLTKVGSQYSIVFLVTLLTTDILSLTYMADSVGVTLKNETTNISSIISGVTGTQGINKVFYNTTQSKYEYYLDNTPSSNTMIFMLNGATLTQNVDYYISSTNSKRIIFNSGLLIVGDIISVYHQQSSDVSQTITTSTPNMSWSIPKPSQNSGSTFTVQMVLYTDKTFSTIKFSEIINHKIGVKDYSQTIGPLTGLTYGDKVLCRVVNNKKYTPISGGTISMSSIGESITLEILSNAINTY